MMHDVVRGELVRAAPYAIVSRLSFLIGVFGFVIEAMKLIDRIDMLSCWLGTKQFGLGADLVNMLILAGVGLVSWSCLVTMRRMVP